MNDNGWIKLYRKLQDWEWYCKSEMVHLFVDLLINANSEDANWRGIDIPKGSLVTSLDKLSLRTGISVRTIRTCLERLEKSGEIRQKTTNKNRLITISQYDIYQEKKSGRRQTNDNQLTGKGQATDNKQEYKNIEDNTTTPNGDSSIVEDTIVVDLIKGVVKGEKWRSDFDTYLSGLRQCYKAIVSDREFIEEQQRFHPGVNIPLSLEKACKQYWSKEAGWKKKKGSKTKEIDWRATFTNALNQSQNKVYEQRDNKVGQERGTINPEYAESLSRRLGIDPGTGEVR